MGNLVLLLTFFFLLAQVTAIQSSHMELNTPAGSGDSFYPDPEGILSSLCDICGVSFLYCKHRYAPLMTILPVERYITPNDLLLHREWPRDPEQNQIEQVPAYQNDQNRRRPLQHAHVQRLNGESTTIQPSTVEVWRETLYKPGDRTSASPQRRSAPKKGGFPCLHPECSRVFNRQCDLRRHNKVHLDKSERPYKCLSCSEAFIYPKDLERHQRTHRTQPVRQQNMYCPVSGCSNTDGFSRKDNFTRHMRKQHPDAALIAAAQCPSQY